MKKSVTLILGLCFLFTFGQDKKTKTELEKVGLSSLKFRSIGPAFTSGRIADIAVNPSNYSEYYLATASGGVWKTNNHGISYQSIFDGQGSYSIGCVSIDPNNSKVIWVGSGENNNQRSVAYGDGLYKSIDAGKSWKKVGLEKSEHIGMIAINPNNSDEVYVAAYGPLWSSGGDRGIYKTQDGGSTWTQVLNVSENTGFNEIHMDPRNPKTLYATAHQRRRHVWTYLSGGPESAIYKSVNGGESWDILSSGIPSGDKGRIALAISPSNPDRIYAMIEGHGVYRSDDRGASFNFKNKYNTSGNYYVELVPHPTDENIVYSMDTWMNFSKDGGESFNRVPEKSKHVDNHCLWINPKDPNQMIAGCDGGLYETYDNADNWHFKPNLPITQFYKVAVDNDLPFYNVYGGTQDNFSLGGPSRTKNAQGISNSDWFVTNTGDGFESAIDPKDPNIVYAQSQYGGLVRFDKKSGESVGIKPSPEKNEAAYRYNWDAPLLISPHNNKRLYFAANKVFRSDDQGTNWRVISNDLSQQIDRHTLPLMGKIWSVDAIAYDKSTSNYGNIVALDESPLQENLLYAGTDDGLIHVSENGGGNWKKLENFPGIPKNTYVNMLVCSKHDPNTVFAVFNNHKNGDFKPYVLKSTNKGASWQNISGSLPDNAAAYSLIQDHKNKNLLFVGTERTVHFSINGGSSWRKLSSGLPTINVRDMDIQERENDLVLATMGRGFYVLDDYSLLRNLADSILEKEAHIFPVKDGLSFMEASPLGYGGVGFQGASFYVEENPATGVNFDIYIKESPKTLKSERQKDEKEKIKNNENPSYPSPEALRAEDREESSYLIFTIKDEGGNEIVRFTKSYSTGINRINWDGRISSNAYSMTKGSPMTNPYGANMALPGKYSVSVHSSEDGEIKSLIKDHSFKLNWLEDHSLMTADRPGLIQFQSELESARRKITAISNYKNELKDRIESLKANTRNTPGADLKLLERLRKLEYSIYEIEQKLNGDQSLSSRNYDTPPSLLNRMNSAVWNSYYSTSEPTGEQKKNLNIVNEEIEALHFELKAVKTECEEINGILSKAGAPYLKYELPELK